jgi:hypothetical protein
MSLTRSRIEAVVIRRHGSPAPHAANAELALAVRVALAALDVPSLELRGENGGRIVVAAIPPTGRLVLAEILGAGSPWTPSINGANLGLREAGAIVLPVHDQMALVMLVDRISRLRDERNDTSQA